MIPDGITGSGLPAYKDRDAIDYISGNSSKNENTCGVAGNLIDVTKNKYLITYSS